MTSNLGSRTNGQRGASPCILFILVKSQGETHLLLHRSGTAFFGTFGTGACYAGKALLLPLQDLPVLRELSGKAILTNLS